ncbi:MAG: DUF3307 domain-containing protein [Lachnospiraceae bacterium]|nr:DUF3307 domain-containing protein [Lachnospiraceae bacterium]
MKANEYWVYLLLVHIIGDFYFKNEKMTKKKEGSYGIVLLHSLLYLVTSFGLMLLLKSAHLVFVIGVMVLIHYIIDTVKFLISRKKKVHDPGKAFTIDQFFHLVSILTIAYFMNKFQVKVYRLSWIDSVCGTFGLKAHDVVRYFLTFLIINRPANCLIQNVLARYKVEERKKAEQDRLISPDVDIKAGRTIGTLERFILVLFMAVGQYGALGLVLTAKSIARYDKITKNEKFAEYYLLGTLLSTTVAVVAWLCL